MDTRSDRGQFYPGGATSSVPAGGATDKVDRVALGEIGENYTLKTVKNKVDQIVRVLAPAAVGCLVLSAWCLVLSAGAATGVLEDLPNTAPVVTNEEDAVAMAAVGALGQAVSNRVEAAENSLLAEIAGATNAVVQAAISAAEAESNRVDATYAKRSEIPAAQDLTPYALKSELPTDYLRENDITNFATRSWISAQGYASGAEVGARIDAQDNAIAAQNAAIATASNALATAHAADVAALRRGTNELARADARLEAKIDALELTGGMTRLWSSDATTYQDATGVVWQVQVATSLWTVVHSWTTNDVNWSGPWWWGAEAAGDDYYDGIGWYISSSSLTLMRMSEDPYASEIVVEWTYWGEEEHSVTTRCTRTVQWLTNAIDRVQYRGDVASATNGVMQGASQMVADSIQELETMGTVAFARQLISEEPGVASVTPSNVWQIAQDATNYTDAATNALREASDSKYIPQEGGPVYSSVQLFLNDELHEQGMLRLELPDGQNVEAERFVSSAQITNQGAVAAAKAVVGPATNAVLQAALGAAASKQDALPYPTNAIPYAAISGAPSGGGQEWRDEWDDAMAGGFRFVTNGMLRFDIDQASIYVETNGWPNGASMFSRIRVMEPSYTWPSFVRLVGYGTWPTNDFQSVWWRSGTNIFVNVLIEE